MADLETDYLVVGAGVSGMGFVDAMAPRAGDVDAIIVDTRHSPGGHWNDAYPFVRLHQPAAVFGADSMRLGDDRIDEHGPNAGFYQLATAPEVVAYYGRLRDALEAGGNVRFMGATQYCGTDGDEHVLRSVVSGKTMTVSVRRRLVDTSYAEPTIPSRHTPSFGVDADARVVPPNALVDLAEVPSGFTVLGAGKTSMDACGWLLAQGVDPDAIRWVRPRDVWMMRRASTQPLKLVGSGFMKLQAEWVKAAALATDAPDLARRLEAGDVFARLDTSIEPEMFRGATVSDGEIEALRHIGDVVRMGRVLHVGASGLKLEQGELPTAPGHLYVDCTASGVRDVETRPVFEPGRITMQLVTLGNVPYSAATVGAVEALVDDDDTRNAMCAPLGGFGTPDRVVGAARVFLNSTPQRMFHPAVGEWNETTRLNSARVLPELADDPEVQAGQATMFEYLGPAMENLARMTGG
mgnify:CR=1 FL=1